MLANNVSGWQKEKKTLKEHPIARELQVASALGDALAVLCPAKTRTFDGAQHELEKALFSDKTFSAFAVIDGARDQRIIEALDARNISAFPIYEEGDEDVIRVSPKLFALSDAEVLAPLFPLIWGEAVGIFFTSSADLKTLLKHLQTLAIAEMPDGDLALLRFFDPRVFPRLMSALDEGQRRQFFANCIMTYCLEDDRGRLISYQP